MNPELQCRLCGCKFTPSQTKGCTCNCSILCKGCSSNNNKVKCPNCGHEVPIETPKTNQTILNKIKQTLKVK